MMPKQMESEKKIWPYAATQTFGSAKRLQSGVNKASKPFAAPGRVSAMPTMMTNITTNKGMKNVDAPATPFCTPKAIIASVNTHTAISGPATLPTKSKPKSLASAICRKSLKKNACGSAPHAEVKE